MKSFLPLLIIVLSLTACGDDAPQEEKQNRYAEATTITTQIETPSKMVSLMDQIIASNIFNMDINLDEIHVISANTLHVYGMYYEDTNNIYINWAKVAGREGDAYRYTKLVETIIHELQHMEDSQTGAELLNPTGHHGEDFYNRVNAKMDTFIVLYPNACND